MTIPPSFSEQDLWCLKHLLDKGWFDDQQEEIKQITKHLSTDFTLVKLESDFFTELASKLRELWPAGEKDGKWPWRDSVANLARRLKTVWTFRDMEKYTIDQCLSAARKYLAQYEDNTKYMRILKYFILKQSSVIERNGKRKIINESLLADMLENMPVFEEEPEIAFEYEGELV